VVRLGGVSVRSSSVTRCEQGTISARATVGGSVSRSWSGMDEWAGGVIRSTGAGGTRVVVVMQMGDGVGGTASGGS
jgi:hypothetical protein